MKAMLYLAALLPLSVMAQPINIDNNPNQPGYVVPSQQRMQNQMQTQQMQQQNNLKQGIQNQSRAQQQHLAVRPLAFGNVGREIAGGGDPLRNLHLPVAGAVFTAFGVVADETLEWRTDIGQLVGKFEQFEEGAVPRHQAQIAIEDGDALVEQIQPGLQHFVAGAVFGGGGRGWHRAILVQALAWISGCNDSLHSANSCARVFCDSYKKSKARLRAHNASGRLDRQ